MNKEVLTEIRKISESLNRIVKLFEEESNEEVNKEDYYNITNLLKDLGVPANIHGYYYIRTGILMVIKNPELIHFVTKELYPEIAKEYNTTVTKVERAIRHAIEKSMIQGDPKLLEEIFSYSYSSQKGKPTNAVYIATLADYLKK